MKYLNEISSILNIEEIYIILSIKTLFYILIITIIEKIGIKLLKKNKDTKKRIYIYSKVQTMYEIFKSMHTIFILGTVY